MTTQELCSLADALFAQMGKRVDAMVTEDGKRVEIEDVLNEAYLTPLESGGLLVEVTSLGSRTFGSFEEYSNWVRWSEKCSERALARDQSNWVS